MIPLCKMARRELPWKFELGCPPLPSQQKASPTSHSPTSQDKQVLGQKSPCVLTLKLTFLRDYLSRHPVANTVYRAESSRLKHQHYYSRRNRSRRKIKIKSLASSYCTQEGSFLRIRCLDSTPIGGVDPRCTDFKHKSVIKDEPSFKPKEGARKGHAPQATAQPPR